MKKCNCFEEYGGKIFCSECVDDYYSTATHPELTKMYIELDKVNRWLKENTGAPTHQILTKRSQRETLQENINSYVRETFRKIESSVPTENKDWYDAIREFIRWETLK